MKPLLLLLGMLAGSGPEDNGPLDVMVFDAGQVPAAGAMLPLKVYFSPSLASPAPLVAVVHGFFRNGSYMRVLATDLASRGFVAIVPDMPCNLSGCDHPANAHQLAALFDWTVMAARTATSPFAGKVDGTRRGIIGHSWGGLASFLTAADGTPLQSMVLLDANDDRGVAAMASSNVHVPSLLIAAEKTGVCNATNWSSTVYPTTPMPKLRIRVKRSGHCDAEDPSDALCPTTCGAGDRTTTPIFRRYAVAWTACNLTGDPAMATYVGGAALDQDVAAGALDNLDSAGLDALSCRHGATVGDGGPGADVAGGLDAAPPAADGGWADASASVPGGDASGEADALSRADAASPIGGDAGTGAGVPAAKPARSGGCTCVRAAAQGGIAWLLLILGAAGIHRKTGRREDPEGAAAPLRRAPKGAAASSGSSRLPVFLFTLLTGCTTGLAPKPQPDASTAAADASTDAETHADATPAPRPDAGAPDAAPADAAPPEAGSADATNDDAAAPSADASATPDGGAPPDRCAFGAPAVPAATRLDPRRPIAASRLDDLAACAQMQPARASMLVDGFLREVDEQGGALPWRNGSSLVLYRGDATGVAVSGSFDNWPSPGMRAFQAVSGTDLWVAEIPVGASARVQYKLTRTGTAGVTWSTDQVNRWVVWDGIDQHDVGNFNNEVTGPSYVPDKSLLRRFFVVDRDVFLQLPVAYYNAATRFGILYVSDGNEMLTRSGMQAVVDQTIAMNQARPMVLAYVALPNQNVRFDEYTYGPPPANGDNYVALLAGPVIAAVEGYVPLATMPDQRGLAGASLGGLISFYGVWTRNDRFRLVGAQSASLFWENNDMITRVQNGPMIPSRVYLDSGSPGDNSDVVTLMDQALTARGYDHHLVLQQGAMHDWSYWAQRFPGLLAFLFPPN